METRFLHASTVIESLRDNGYNNTAYALAELIDNSIQAGADRVELGFIEEQIGGAARKTYNVTEISVWDNGKGMSPAELRQAMQFGGSLNRKDPKGMGKFGMGLPNSSISQCRRVDVWSWVNGSEPHHTYLDIDKMKDGELEIIPHSEPKDIPAKYRTSLFEQMPNSGTLVVWSKLDRLNWKTGRSNFRHCEFLVGRMYRRYLENDKVKIYAITYRPKSDISLEVYGKKEFFRANDPMYLMKNTSLPPLPDKYESEAFFHLLDAVTLNVDYLESNGERVTGDVTIRTSIAKNSIVRYILESESSKGALGNTKWGKDCAKNIGVSIMRADRELALRDSFINPDIRQYKARYIGIEIDFPPSLDRLFGVTNNKQDAVKLIPYDIKALADEAGCDMEADYLNLLKEDEDPFLHTLDVISTLQREVQKAEKAVELLPVTLRAFKGNQPGANGGSAEKATAGSRKREQEGKRAVESDPIKLPELTELLTESGMPEEEAKEKAKGIIEKGIEFDINVAPRDSEAFFDVSTRKGMTLVTFNSNHVFYKDFISELSATQREILEVAIAGYARVMNETTSTSRVDFMNSIRRRWGEVITDFISDDFEQSNEL